MYAQAVDMYCLIFVAFISEINLHELKPRYHFIIFVGRKPYLYGFL